MKDKYQIVKCIQGNRLFTKEKNYTAYMEDFKIKVNCNFGTLCDVEVNTNMFGGYKQKDGDNVAIFIIPEAKLEGNELCKVMLERGDNYIMCFVSNENEATAEFHRNAKCVQRLVAMINAEPEFHVGHDLNGEPERWKYAVPIDSTGKILTQKEVGL